MFNAVRGLVRRWTRRRPLVVATFLVRDERDIIGFNIEHCLDLGVQHIIVTENCSVDGTIDLLRAYERAGAVTLIREPADDYRQGEWVTRMARLAASRFAADWVFNLDADEFIWTPPGIPPGPQLLLDTVGEVPPDHGYFNLRREDMRTDPGVTADWWLESNVLRDLDTRSWRSGRPLLPKAVHRADAEVTVSDGNHAAHGPRIRPMGEWSARMVLLHFPDRGYRHYENKIRVGGAALIARGSQSGIHWQEDFGRLERGTLRDAYAERQVSAAELPAMLGSGKLVRESEFGKRMAALRERSGILRSAAQLS
jgi:hypothetical protein